MPVEDRTRHDRLRSLLPRVYATDPRRHALGVMLEVLGDGLREADGFTERALRDRWLRTSSAPRELAEVVGLDGRAGWIDSSLLPASMVAQVEAEAASLGGRLIRMFAPAGDIDALSFVVVEITAPADVEAYLDEDEGGALAALKSLLIPIAPALGEPEASDRIEAAGSGGVELQRARWHLDGGTLEAAWAPAGPFTALVIARGPDLEPWREHLEAFVGGLRGLSGEGVPPLPAVSLGGPPHPLELLGAALDLRRQPWEVEVETYRNRVRILAPMLTEGLATPRVMLAFALTSLHAEPCPILERPEPDSTRGYGMPPRTLDRCRVCQGGRRPPPGSSCPMRESSRMQATVTDNPRTRATLTRSRLEPGARLRIHSDSLFAARPKIVLRVSETTLAGDNALVPRLRSLTTGEELIVPVPLGPGDELTIRPASPYQPDRPRHRQIWADPPSGEQRLPARAWIVRADNTLEVVDEIIMYAAGPRFGRARFAGLSEAAIYDAAHFEDVAFDMSEPDMPEPDAETEQFRFASAELGAQAPALMPGENTWLLTTLSGAELEALAGDYELPEDFTIEPFQVAPSPVSLELSWWTRPPARFRIRVPRKPAVERALARGAAGYLRKLVDRVRPAGVHPIIDFAVEPIQEALEPEDRFAAMDLRRREALEPEVRHRELAQEGRGEALEPEDRLGFLGIFDVTLFDMSLFAERDIEPAYFDRTVFDKALLHGHSAELAELDESYFDFALLADHGKGSFGEASFDMARFA